MKKIFFKVCMIMFVLFIIIGEICPVFSLSTTDDGVMGQNSILDGKTNLTYAKKIISQGWLYQDGVKCFYDNNGNLIGENVKKIIDVSQYNGEIDWEKVSKTDIDGVIIRIVSHSGGYYHIDSQFKNNLNGCRKYNIPFGLYIYDYSNSTTDADNEATMIMNYLKQYSISPSELSYPLYLDMERDSISKSLNEQIVDVFVNKLVNAGYNTKVYSYRSLLQTKLNSPVILQHVDWVAAYTDVLGFENKWYSGPKGWQYTNGAMVDGIYGNNGYVDMSVWYDQNIDISKYYDWRYYNNQWYYGNKNGILQIGWEFIDNKWYYFNTSGEMQKGWLKLGSTWYYLNSSGEMLTGLQTIKGKLYYFSTSGAMQIGWQNVNDHRYYFNGNGYALKGWQCLNDKWYYFNDNFQMQTGLQNIENDLFYLDANGVMQKGWKYINSKWYYFNNSGYALKGWLKIGDVWYYMDDNYQMHIGWLKLGNTWYYLKSSGAMATGWLKLGNTWYYLKSSGAMATGWLKLGNTWYYLKSSGAMATGWLKLGNTWYYLKSSGAMATGSLTIDGIKYRFNSSGAWIG